MFFTNSRSLDVDENNVVSLVVIEAATCRYVRFCYQAVFPDVIADAETGTIKISQSDLSRSQPLPFCYEPIARAAITGDFANLSYLAYLHYVFPLFVERRLVPSTRGNIEDLGYTFH